MRSARPDTIDFDVLIIGGGPAASAAARLLARWGHRVGVLARIADRGRGQAESLPPSAAKLLAAVGVLDAVEGAGFYRSTGNTVWWASQDRRLELFDATRERHGYQVFRPDLDRLLLEEAGRAGATVAMNATVRTVSVARDLVTLDYERDGQMRQATARFVLDASGRAGVIARRGFRRHARHLRMQALMGVWCRDGGWSLPDDTHTIVETFSEGWAWSVPVSSTMRHVGVMVDGTTVDLPRRRVLEDVYRGQLAKTRQLRALTDSAHLEHAWACDASIYDADIYAGTEFLLVGDAASTIDPLSSFGIKKALGSAWMASVTVHTYLRHGDRRSMALDYYSALERQVHAAHLRQTRDFARQAYLEHRHAFWARRAELELEDLPTPPDDDMVVADPEVHAALTALKSQPTLDLVCAGNLRWERRPLVRGREIVLAEAMLLPRARTAMRFLGGVDLIGLCDLARRHRHVGDLYDAYCRTVSPVPLRSLLGGLSVLLANRILRPRSSAA